MGDGLGVVLGLSCNLEAILLGRQNFINVLHCDCVIVLNSSP